MSEIAYEKARFTLNTKIGVNFENGNLTRTDSVVYDWLKQKELSITEIIDLLNNFDKECIKLKLELNTHKHPLWSTREAERVVNELRNENEQLKQELKYIYDIATLNKAIDLIDKIYDEYLWASPSDEIAAAKREGMKECIDALQDYKDDLE